MKIIGLDVGEKRIGVARADSSTRIAVPVGFVKVDGLEWQEIAQVAKINNTNFFVLGLPRSNEGNETEQSLYVRNFARTLMKEIPGAKVRLQDESLTSVMAEERLKASKKKYKKGDIDAEAAAIILQDFLESFTVGAAMAESGMATEQNAKENNFSPAPARMMTGVKNAAAGASETVSNLAKKEADKARLNTKKVKHKMKKATKLTIMTIMIVLVGLAVGGGLWVKTMLEPVGGNCGENCETIAFSVADGDSKAVIAENLERAGLIRNSLVFKGYFLVFKSDANFRSGDYTLNTGQSVAEIIEELERGPVGTDVFSFTIRPGETIHEIRDNLIGVGYSATEVDQALSANYDFAFLQGRPKNATLEGYLYGETHEFYLNTPVREIIETFLSGMGKVIEENDLEARYAKQGLSLFEGVTLASIVQKEATGADMAIVAQVFLSRLDAGMLLGSDVTVSYALDTIDPGRQAYSENGDALAVDSCYNTRLYRGLPCGPISNPGLLALLAVAEPSDTAYLYFLTGDDGLMYYSYTEDEHLQKVYTYCQNLCSVSL